MSLEISYNDYFDLSYIAINDYDSHLNIAFSMS